MSDTGNVFWISARFGTEAAMEEVRGRVASSGHAILRGKGTAARRVLARVASDLPAGLVALRIPEPRNDEVTTLIVHREGEPSPAMWPGDDEDHW